MSVGEEIFTGITGVVGVTRSGTSLMMAMLKAGGMELFHDPESEISYETRRVFDLPQDHEWLTGAQGKAVKLIDAQGYIPLPSQYRYRFILMRRNPTQQALSFQKFTKALMGADISDSHLDEIRQSIRRDIKAIERHLPHRGPYLVVQFEDVIRAPEASAERVARFLGLRDSWSMANTVLDRSANCFDGLLELKLETIYASAERFGVPPRMVYQRIQDAIEAGERVR